MKKPTEWNEMLKQVKQLVDANGMPVDEGVEETVVALNLLGLDTIMSCWGHDDRNTLGPYIMFGPEEAMTLEKEWSKEATKDRSSPAAREKKRIAEDAGRQYRHKIHELLVEFYATYPMNYDSLLVLEPIGMSATWLGVSSNQYGELFGSDLRQERLRNSRREIEAFTEFLKTKLKDKEKA